MRLEKKREQISKVLYYFLTMEAVERNMFRQNCPHKKMQQSSSVQEDQKSFFG